MLKKHHLVLGFFNILFAWLGLFCFFIPLIISITKGTKSYCNRYCGRGQLFGLLGGRSGLSRKKDIPRWMKSKVFRYGFLIFFYSDAMPDNLLVFHLKDGTTHKMKWAFPSRSESWTVEMREKAAEQMRRRYAKTGN